MKAKRFPMAKTRLATCRHEAAHWVIAEGFGVKPKYAHVPPSDGKHVGGRAYVQFGRMGKMGPVQWSIALMAGSVAEHLWHGTPRGLVSAHDLKEMLGAGMKGEDFRVIWEESQRMVRRAKGKIWRLAKRLNSGKVYRG